jgi:hypothetical protein
MTNNTTRVWIDYRIYSLRRFTAATQVTIKMSTLALVVSRIRLTELHCADVSLRELTHALIPETDWRRLTPKADGRGLTRALCCLPYITLGPHDGKPGRPTVGC